MVCLPEHFAYMNMETVATGGKSFYLNEELNLKLFHRYRQLALDNQVWLSLGCFPEYSRKTG